MKADTLVVLGTGGTIAGRSSRPDDRVGYTAGQIAVDDLLQGLPLPSGPAVVAEQVAQVDSKNMGPTVWRPLLERVQHHLGRPEVRGIVVTHGTDTLEETAYLLQALLNPAKPVVLTCAMRPATALVPDGPQNLADALAVASEAGARGVVAVCAGRIHGALEVQKVHTSRLDAFDSGDAGPIGAVDAGRCTVWRPWPDTTGHHDPERLPRLLALTAWPRVEWISSHAGATGEIVRALLAQQAEGGSPPLQGLMVAGTGNATLHDSLLEALLQAQEAGVRVWRTTRCAAGRVRPASDGELFTSVSLSPSKARLALMLDLV